MSARVIGLGQAVAGDDAVGLAVLEHVRRMGPPPGTELVTAPDASALVELLQTARRVIVVDAVVGAVRAGEVLDLPEQAFARNRSGPLPLSTHGVTLGQAVELARVLASGAVADEIVLVGVAIDPPQRYTCGLSPAVQGAIPVAARLVLARVGGVGMHESSLARQLLAVVLDRARRSRAVAVRSVRGWVAETEALSAESLAFHFAVLAAGTIADGARLELDVRRVDARCRACAATYRPDHHVLFCPACGSTDASLLGETGLGIDAIEVSLEGGA